jgi:hypothetical protein
MRQTDDTCIFFGDRFFAASFTRRSAARRVHAVENAGKYNKNAKRLVR